MKGVVDFDPGSERAWVGQETAVDALLLAEAMTPALRRALIEFLASRDGDAPLAEVAAERFNQFAEATGYQQPFRVDSRGTVSIDQVDRDFLLSALSAVD